MPFSSGTYNLPGPALAPGDTVSSVENNQFRNDVATAFNETFLRDGTAEATANLPMGGFKLTGLAAGTTAGDSVRYDEFAALESEVTALESEVTALESEVTALDAAAVKTTGDQGISGFKTFYNPVVAYQTGSIYGQFNAISGSGSSWYKSVYLQGGNSMYLLGSAMQTSASAATTAAWSSFRPFTWNLDTGAVTIAAAGESVTILGDVLVASGPNPNCMSLDSSAVNGANLLLTGTGGSPSAPNKYIRSRGGVLEVMNSAYTAQLMQVYDTGDLAFNSGYGSSRVAYGCRAWVNFNGTGTVAIRGSGGVSSITDNGVGDYTVNFATEMVDANYGFSVASGSQVNSSGYSYTSIYPNTAPTTSSLRVSIPGVVVDTLYNSVQIFR